MKLAYVGAIPPLQGGVSQHGAYLVAALRDRGHEVTIESWHRQYPNALFPGQSQIDSGAAPVPGASYRLSWRNPIGWWLAGRRLRRHDALLFPWITQFQGIALRVIRVAAGIPAIAIVHNPVPHDRRMLVRPLTRLGLVGTRGALFHSADAPVELDAVTGVTIPRTRIIAMPPLLPVDPHPLPPVPPLRLLLFGFVRPYKGADTAVAALAELRAGGVDAQLTIAGELWGDEAELRACLRTWQVEQVVDLRLGYVKDEEVDELFREHHIALAPYHSATQSGIIPLAMKAQRPVVATRVGGLAEQVQDGVNGILVPPMDATALASAIQAIASDLERFSKATRGSLPDWAHVAREVEELIG